MRTFLLVMLLLLVVSNPIAHATDVEYSLSINNVTELTEEKLASPFSVEVKDRVWVCGGIEESSDQIKKLLVPSDDLPHVRHLRLEPSPNSIRNSYSVEWSDLAERAPDWIDDELWPRTKEVLHYGNEARPSATKPVEVFYFGRIGMTR